MSQQELLRRVVQVLSEAEIDYMLTGSVVSSLQGEPRATHDIDIVISIQQKAIPPLLQAFPPPDFYLSEDAVRQSLRDESMFNLISVNDGGKVDFWILRNEPFDQSRFSRKQIENIFELPLKVSSPEDTILVKLNWAKLSGGSERQFRDALRVYEVQQKRLDENYIVRWAKILDVSELWLKLKSEAEPL